MINLYYALIHSRKVEAYQEIGLKVGVEETIHCHQIGKLGCIDTMSQISKKEYFVIFAKCLTIQRKTVDLM